MLGTCDSLYIESVSRFFPSRLGPDTVGFGCSLETWGSALTPQVAKSRAGPVVQDAQLSSDVSSGCLNVFISSREIDLIRNPKGVIIGPL